MGHLDVRLLGQFELRLDGQLVDLSSRPAQSLLAYLALTAGIAHRRERLAGMLWPDTSESNARNNLRQALFRLRQAIETGDRSHLLADANTLTFDAESEYWLDAAALEKKDTSDALAAYRGELLPGFYEEWVVLERERLRAAFERKMQQWLEKLVEGEQWDEVLEWGERWISLGGAPEPAYRALMMAQAGQSDIAGVVAVYERCVEALRNELGVEPSKETQRLYEQLRTGQDVSLPSLRRRVVAPRLIDEPPAPGEPPFKGLQYFDTPDADLFFGRELLTARLVGHLREHRFLAVIVGASGSGKSSIVRAGLVPALKKGERLADGTLPPEGCQHWRIQIITPTSHPLAAISALSLMQKGNGGEGQPLLLVVDQFEELFTLCHDELERRTFINKLMVSVSGGEGSTIVVITLRADFYAHCAQYANLRESLAKYQEYIGPMNAEELRRAIEEPARRNNWEFEPGLVDLILRDIGVGEDRQPEPGALPLLSHALLETWQRRRGRMLTLKGYAECGGVHGAIARTAETVYRKLTDEGQAVARNLFIRLTGLGQGESGVDTRRRVSRSELITSLQSPALSESILQTLTDSRLLTTSTDSVEVAHEALIREWPTLHEWLSENREGLRLHRHLTEAAQAWDVLNRDPGELYRGARLSQATEWAEENPNELNVLEREFLEASQAEARREEAEREASRQRELAAAKQAAETEQRRAAEQSRNNRRLRWLAVGLGLFLLAALLSAAVAFQQRTRAEREARLAASRELAAAALTNLNIDPERSVLLALSALDSAHTTEAENALHRALLDQHLLRMLRGHTGVVWNVALSSDGARIITAGFEGVAKIWDAESGAELLTFTGHTSDVFGVAFSPDGKRAATASSDGTAKVWDAATGEELLTLRGHTVMQSGEPLVTGVAFSPDGTRIATSSFDRTAILYNARTGEPLLTLRGHTDAIYGFAFSPDGRRIATAGYDGLAKVWDTMTGDELLTLAPQAGVIQRVAFSPDGARLLTADDRNTATLFDLTTGAALLTLEGHTGPVHGVAFSPDASRLATASLDATTKIWDARTGQELLTLVGHNGPVEDVAFLPDGRRLVTVSGDGTARLWDLAPGHESFAVFGNSAVYSPDGRHLATAGPDSTVIIYDAETGERLLAFTAAGPEMQSLIYSLDGKRLVTASGPPLFGDGDSVVEVWDAGSGQRLITLPGPEDGGHMSIIVRAVFSPDGNRLATGGFDQTAKIWDISSAPARLIHTLSGHATFVWDVAFSPDGTRLVTGSWDDTAKIWDAGLGKELLTLPAQTQPHDVFRAAFSPDGKHLALGLRDGSVLVLDPATGEEILRLAAHTSFVVSLAFSPDGSRLATSAFDNAAKVWDMTTGEERLSLVLPAGVQNVAFNADGTRLVTSTLDGVSRVHVLPLRELISLARFRVTRSLTTDECQRYLHIEQCP